MKATLGGCIALALVFTSVPPTLPDDELSPDKVISEDDARIISARLYSAILTKACRSGWRYPLSHVKSGFERHFDEFKLQLVSNGYITFQAARSRTAASNCSYRRSLPTMAPRRGLGVPGSIGWRNGDSEKGRLTCPSEALGIRR